MDRELLRESITLLLLLSFGPLAAAAVLGLTSNLIQAVTQIQEQTFSYIVKLVAVGGMLYFFGNRAFQKTVTLIQSSILSMR